MTSSTVKLTFDLPTINMSSKNNSRQTLETTIDKTKSNLEVDKYTLNDIEDVIKLDDFQKPLKKLETTNHFTANWLKLPHELWMQIFTHLNHRELINLSRTCKMFRNLYLDSSLCNYINNLAFYFI
jgi:DNA polymerase II large subunit